MRYFLCALALFTLDYAFAEMKEIKDRNGRLIERYNRDSSTRRVGKRETFFENGKVQTVSEWSEGRIDSETEYFDDGKVARKSIHKKEGTHPEIERTEYYQNGKMKLHTKREFGKWPVDTVEVTEIYYDNGNMQSSTKAKGGRSLGEQKTFDLKGRQVSFETYGDDFKPTGIWIFNTYDKDVSTTEDTYEKGKLSKRVVLDGDKKKVSETTFYPDGSTKEEKKF